MTPSSQRPGRLLGVDFGTKRVGLAISDDERRIASPLRIHVRTDLGQDARSFETLMKEENVAGIVVGLPVHGSGQEGQKARKARVFGAWLQSITHLPVTFWDERYTTVEAERHLLDAGLTKKRRQARLDKVAAQILLQSYLDAGCPETEDVLPLES